MGKTAIRGAKARNFSNKVTRLLLIVLLSLCAAIILTLITSVVISSKVLFGNQISPNEEANILFLMFSGTLLLSLLVPTLNYFKKIFFKKPPSKKAKPTGKTIIPSIPAPESKKTATKHKKVALSSRAYKQILNKLEQAESQLSENIPKKTPETPVAIRENTELDQKPSQESQNNITTKIPSSSAPKDATFIVQFLGDALGGSTGVKKIFDNFNKFGINLWLAGSCEIFVERERIGPNGLIDILTNSVQVMGFKKSHATSFSKRYEEYLLQDPRYMQMFQSGRNAMNYYLIDTSKISVHLDKALTDWNKPTEKEEAPKIVTVLFTDIAGSTALTQKLGDAGAQILVRIHNQIVREALHHFHGNEIKHTGDGIMASFNQASEAIEAAMMIQRGVAAHNIADPTLPLQLKIGINSGEPIQEDNDLFGTMVQLSARIVDKAKGNQILVSETVRGICAGKSYRFEARGAFPMKGFTGELNLYDVKWTSTNIG